jgi:cbb3-type cytochrome oxidase subunit 3
MQLTILDIALFLIFFIVVIGVSMFKSRREKTGEDFFLASRGLIWPLIGLLIFVGGFAAAMVYILVSLKDRAKRDRLAALPLDDDGMAPDDAAERIR